jgi:uncharacterized protein
MTARVEDLRFRNRRGQRLAATRHGPAGWRPGDGAVVICHGMLSSRASPKHVALCDELARRGLLALRFDFAGRGESEGETAEITYERQVEDLDAAVSSIRAETDRIGLIGSSMGGGVAILFAQGAPDVRCVAGIAAVGRPRVVLERLSGAESIAGGGGVEIGGAWLGPGFVRSTLETDVLAAARALRCPLLLVHGALDATVTIDQAIELRAAAADARLEVIPDGDHLLHAPEHQRFLERVMGGFMAAHLGDAIPRSCGEGGSLRDWKRSLA